jgi:hypothetical protein
VQDRLLTLLLELLSGLSSDFLRDYAQWLSGTLGENLDHARLLEVIEIRRTRRQCARYGVAEVIAYAFVESKQGGITKGGGKVNSRLVDAFFGIHGFNVY